MKRLDYKRVSTLGVDPMLRDFLIGIHAPDTVRRVQVSFPEFFTDDPCIEPVHRSILERRFQDLTDVVDEHLVETFAWFGLTVITFVPGIASKGEHSLPLDFVLERDSQYNGLTSDDPWITTLKIKGSRQEEFLVLDILEAADVDDGETPYFLSAIPSRYVLLEDISDVY